MKLMSLLLFGFLVDIFQTMCTIENDLRGPKFSF